MTTVLWIAIAVVLGQGVMIGAVFYLVVTFGAYAKARDRDAKTQQNQNLMIQMQNWNLSKDLATIRANNLARPTHSEDAVA